MGGVDAAILERLAKVMSYMRVTAGSKPGKRLKKKDKMRLLEAGDVAMRPLNSAPLSEPAPCGEISQPLSTAQCCA